MRRVLFLFVIISLTACTTNPAQESGMPMIGDDSDAHGCKGSAGYTWCARTNSCVRPWELAKEKGFEGSEEGFKKYCAGGE